MGHDGRGTGCTTALARPPRPEAPMPTRCSLPTRRAPRARQLALPLLLCTTLVGPAIAGTWDDDDDIPTTGTWNIYSWTDNKVTAYALALKWGRNGDHWSSRSTS